MHDLAVIIVSTNEAHWLRRCLPTVFAAAGAIDVDVVVVDNESTDGTADLVRSDFPDARIVPAINHGFPHANNRALMTVDARYVLFLNPDTEILEGRLDELLRRLDEDPEIGVAGVKQQVADGRLWPTMRRFPSPLRVFLEMLGSEHYARRVGWIRTRELDMSRYEQEFDLDWTQGSFMLVRREALESAGWWDERFFLYSDEVDLAYRIKRAGWRVRHLPQMRILHHAAKAGLNPRTYAQLGHARRVYSAKHFALPRRLAFRTALASYFGSRALAYRVLRRSDPNATIAMGRAAWALIGPARPPYEPAPPMAVRPRAEAEEAVAAGR